MQVEHAAAEARARRCCSHLASGPIVKWLPVKLSFLPLLQVQRDLYALPRGMERFREYIKTMTDAETGDLALPLVAMNPMGKEHIPALIDEYIALGAEQIAQNAIESAERSYERSHERSHERPHERPHERTYERSYERPDERSYKVCLVVSDDLKGGWTNRWASEYNHRIESAAIRNRGWLTALLWTSEPASAATVRESVLIEIYRAEYLQTHRAATTLREMMAQEGYAAARAGCTTPALDPDDLAYTRAVVAPHLDAHDRATVIACLFGDPAAIALGYPPQGLSGRAGLALALAEAQGRLA